MKTKTKSGDLTAEALKKDALCQLVVHPNVNGGGINRLRWNYTAKKYEVEQCRTHPGSPQDLSIIRSWRVGSLEVARRLLKSIPADASAPDLSWASVKRS